MRAATSYRRTGGQVIMTPMIDVVFLLIIFFLVSSHLARQEVQMDLDLPKASQGESPAEDDARRIVVNVLSEGRIQVGAKEMDVEAFAALIRYESRKADRQLEVRIRSDRKVPCRTVQPIMVACARSGVWKVTFAVISEE